MKKTLFSGVLLLVSILSLISAELWTKTEPIRLIQTNLREIDLIDFDVDQYVEDLKSHGANTVLINVGGIVANYPSELHFEYVNPNLKSDVIGEVVERMHAEGLRVIGRFDFSKINESIALQNPEWLYVSVDGEHVNYNGQVHACVNGKYRQKLKLEILGEVIERYELDGIFFNMPGYQVRDYSHNYHGICQSDACRDRFGKWSGGLDLPIKEDPNDPIFLKYDEFRNMTKNEMFQIVCDFIHEKAPDVSICTYVDDGVDLRRLESGSAMHRSHEWEYQSTDNVKRIRGSFSDKQVANAAVHFVSFAYRHSSVSPHLTEKRLVENMFHGGALDFYCIGRLDNQEDRASLNKVSEVFNFHQNNEKYFRDIEPKSEICLLTTGSWEGSESVKGFMRLLTENHLQYDMILASQLTAENLTKSLEHYELLLVPNISNMSDETCSLIDQYVNDGGKLFATGYISTKDEIGNKLGKIRLKSLGVQEIYRVQEKRKGTYFRITDNDKSALSSVDLSDIDILFLNGDFLECELKAGATEFLKLIPQAMFGPPEKCYYEEVSEIPGMISYSFGEGQSVYIPWAIGEHYQFRSHHGHGALMLGTILDLCDYEPSIETDAHPLVEVSHQVSKDHSFSWLGLVNHSGQISSAFHEPLPIFDTQFRVQVEGAVSEVKQLRKGSSLDFVQDGNWVEFTVSELGSYDMLVIEK